MTPAETVTAFLDAFECRDFDAAGALLAREGFRYDGPIDRFHDARAFIDNISSIGQILDGDDVCVICSFWTTIEEIEHTRVALWFQTRDGRIERIESFLDVRAYARMFDPER